MKNRPARLLSGMVVLLVIVVCRSSLAEQKSPALIIGCENNIRGKKWKDYRIGFGVTNLIADNLYESGRFTLIEEKPAIREKLTAVKKQLWNTGKKNIRTELAGLPDSVWNIMGRLVYCGTPRTNVRIGPMHMNRSTVIVKVEVEALSPDGAVYIGAGKGDASRTAMSTLFEYREDRVLFEQTQIGMALQKAFTEAVNDMITTISKESTDG